MIIKKELYRVDYYDLLHSLKYDYLVITVDEGYFSSKRYSFRIGTEAIKFENERFLPGVQYEDLQRYYGHLKKDPYNSWNVKYKHNYDYLLDFSRFITSIKNLAFNSEKIYQVEDTKSFVLKFGCRGYRTTMFIDYFEKGDTAYEAILELVHQFVEKWSNNSYLPWKNVED